MAATVHCRRCGRAEAPALPRAPLPGPFGREVLEHNCADCWGEWMRAEVMVINELRLNFMDPAAQETLNQQMREFLDPAARQAGSGVQGSAAKPAPIAGSASSGTSGGQSESEDP